MSALNVSWFRAESFGCGEELVNGWGKVANFCLVMKGTSLSNVRLTPKFTFYNEFVWHLF
jgi:hypothetical protein